VVPAQGDGGQQTPPLVANRPGKLDPLGLEGGNGGSGVIAQQVQLRPAALLRRVNSDYAGVVGRRHALQISKSLQTSTSITAPPRATAFATTPLGIQAPGVHEERLNVDPGADKDQPRYRITGLRFLVRSGRRMFLLHDGWTPQRGTVIVVPDNDQVRWPFSR
jgi:hypothetical protein